MTLMVVSFLSPIFFIQSNFFAKILTKFARENLLDEFGIEGGFRDLSVKVFPPGIQIRKPSVILRQNNIAGLPAGIQINAKTIDVTFEFIQLITGLINVNSIEVNEAQIEVKLTKEFFLKKPTEKKKGLNWQTISAFKFRSLGLLDSNLKIELERPNVKGLTVIKTTAKELTIGKTTVDREATFDVGIDLTDIEFKQPEYEQNLNSLYINSQVTSKYLKVRKLGVQDGQKTIHIDGLINGNVLDPQFLIADLRYLMKGQLEDWIQSKNIAKIINSKNKILINGKFSTEGKIKGDLLKFQQNVIIENNLNIEKSGIFGWNLDGIAVQSNFTNNKLNIDNALIKLDKGSLQVGKTSIDFANMQNQEIKTSLEFKEADLHSLLGPEVESVYSLWMKLSGKSEVSLQLRNQSSGGFKLHANNDFYIKDFVFDNQKLNIKKPVKVLFAIPNLNLKSTTIVSNNGFILEKAEGKLPNSTFVASGKINSKDGFDLDINGNVNFKDLGKLGAFDIEGVGPLHWTVKGVKPDVMFTFEADMKEAKYLNLNLGNVKGKVIYDDNKEYLYFKNLFSNQGKIEATANGYIDLGNTDTIDINVKVPKGSVQDFAQMFSFFINKSLPWYPYELTGLLNGDIKVSGKTSMDQLVVLGDMNVSNINYQYELFKQGKLRAGYDKGAFVARNVSLQKKMGWTYGNIEYGADDIMKFNFKSDGWTTLDIDRLALLDIPYRAGLEFEGTGIGKLGSLKSKTKVRIGSGSIKNYSVASSEANILTENGRMKINMSIFGGKAGATIDYGWLDNSNSEFDGYADKLDFLPVLAALNPVIVDSQNVSTEVSGRANVKFRTGYKSKMTGFIDLNSYAIRKPKNNIILDKPIHIVMNEGTYRFGPSHLRGEGTDLSIDGKSESGQVFYDINGKLNLGLFELAVPELESIIGSAEIKATLRGKADDPKFKAEVNIADADIRTRSFPQPFENTKCKIHWDDSNIYMSDLQSKFAGGNVTGLGTAELFASKAPTLDFNFNVNNSKIQVYPVTYARVLGKLSVKGTQLPYQVKGNLNVAEALIKESFSNNQNSKMLKSSKFFPSGSTTNPNEFQLIEMDIDLLAEKGVYVKNDLFDAELRGNLKLLHTPKSPKLLGNVNVIHGKMFFKDNYFTFQSGNLRFNNPAVLDPEFDMNGTTEVKGYKVSLSASGKVSEYQLNFQSQPILSQNDIVNLLTLGVTSSGYQDIARGDREAYTRDEMVGLIFNQTSINKGLQEKLGLKVRVDQSTSSATPESVFRASSNDVTPTIAPKVVIQKEVTKNLNASAGTTVGVGESRQQNVDLEYRVGKNWSLLGTYEDQRGTQPQNSRTSLGADLKFKLKFK